MSTFVLKIIAILTMLIDHIGAVLINSETDPQLWLVLRSIGRLAFPIFCFLIVEGFYHTKNVKKYLIRLGAFALISEVPFDLVHGYVLEFTYQNVFFTLFLGLLLIHLMKQVEMKYKKEVLVSNVLDALLTFAFCAAAAFMRTDYSIQGILIIVAFYLFRGNKVLLTLGLLIVNGMFGGSILAAAAMIPIAFYNGEKGRSAKYLFYIFYPAHLLILYLIKVFIL